MDSLKALTTFSQTSDELINVHPRQIDPDPLQDRTDWDDPETQEHIKNTTESVRTQGVRRPIEVRQNPDDPARWIIIAGEVRWRSAINAEVESVPCLWRKVISDEQASLDQLTENVSRFALKPLELAAALQKRIDAGISRADIIKATGKSKSWVSKRLALLKLSPEITGLIQSKLVIDPDNLLALDKLPPDEKQAAVAAIEKGQSVTKILQKAKKDKAKDLAESSETEAVSTSKEVGNESQQVPINFTIDQFQAESLIRKYQPDLLEMGSVAEAWDVFLEG